MNKCPYCGKVIEVKVSLGRHKAACPEKPENRAAILQWLPHPEFAGHIRSEQDYRRNTPNHPSSGSLAACYGGKWTEVAKAFGLQPLDPNRFRLLKKMNATEAELRRLAEDLHAGQHGPTRKEYILNRNVGGAGTGSVDVCVLGQRFGSWAQVLEHFGLTEPPEKERDYTELKPTYNEPYWFTGYYSISNSPCNFAFVEGCNYAEIDA